MRQIFVFTAANAKAQENLGKSIENPVEDEERVFDNFDDHHHEELKGIREEAGRFYAWGAVWGIRNVPTWEQMERDDFVLCVYDGIYRYVARLLAKYDNPEMPKDLPPIASCKPILQYAALHEVFVGGAHRITVDAPG